MLFRSDIAIMRALPNMVVVCPCDFAEAEAAVRAVLDEDPSGYEAEWAAITRSYRWLTNGLLWTGSHRRLRPMIVPAAQRLPFAFRRIVDSLAS